MVYHILNTKLLRVLLLLGTLLIFGCASSGKYYTFAQCITDNGAVMYGAYWCPHCAEQKEKFGNSFKNVNYVECSLPDRQGKTQICNEAGITAYPTWEFANGQKMEGLLSLEELSLLTGCPISS